MRQLALISVLFWGLTISGQSFGEMVNHRWPAYAGSVVSGSLYGTAQTIAHHPEAFSQDVTRWRKYHRGLMTSDEWNARAGSYLVIGLTMPINFKQTFMDGDRWYMFLADFGINTLLFTASATVTNHIIRN